MKKISLLILLMTTLYTFESCSILQGGGSKKEQLFVVTTDYGDIKCKLYNDTPLHRDNFIKLVKEGVYDGTLFHRVIPEFMVQGGDPDSKTAQAGAALGSGDLGYTIPAEFNPAFCHKRGALAAARRGGAGNPEKKSSASQFYFVVGKAVRDKDLDRQEQKHNFKYTDEQRATYKEMGGTPFLDQDYTVFGEIVEGLELIDQIASVKRNRKDRPDKDVKMTVKLVKK